MTTTVNINRQTVLHAERDFSYDDFTSGTAKAMIYLPPGARILSGFVDVTTAFNSGTSDAIVVGDTEGVDDVDRYIASCDGQATGVTAFTARTTGTTGVPGQVIGTAEAVTVRLTSVGTARTAGAGKLVITYAVDSRVTEYHAYRG